ncbi:hypothetical protein AVEN_62311-1 [Araneus ventricosus]|uniref:Uncharacterized protein n=1 Tax=Araneus ventricosus TaxID=182803 RepID=A0A4Y2KUE3_ARAVE|nr:hypothetical protein AVEN_62311-1 [Araneus ventricosus]
MLLELQGVPTVLPTGEKPCLTQTSRRKEGNGYKINHNIWHTKRSSLGENSFSTEEQSEIRLLPVLSATNEMKPFSSPHPPKCSGVSRSHNDCHRNVWCLGFFSWR